MARLPTPDKRTSVIGSTGSGKTQFAVWLLSSRDFHIRPCVIFDFKGDELIGQLGAQEISVSSDPPKEAGLYIIRPLPGDEEYVSRFFMKCLYQEDIIIYIDEGYMLPKLDRWFRACLTQGRSKHIEMIILSQRPVWMDKYVFTEANFFAVFKLNSVEDRKHMRNFLDGRELTILPQYHCLWYDVDKQQSTILRPVPQAEDLIATFRAKLKGSKMVKI
jgi:DNA helicase HerA-like ATPase